MKIILLKCKYENTNFIFDAMVYCAIFYTNRPSKLHFALQCVESYSNILFFYITQQVFDADIQNKQKRATTTTKLSVKIQYNAPFFNQGIFCIFSVYLFKVLFFCFCSLLHLNVQCFSTVLFNHTFVHLLNYQLKNIVTGHFLFFKAFFSTVTVNSANRSREVSLTGRFALSLM